MDDLLKSLKEIKAFIKYQGSIQELAAHDALTEICRKHKIVPGSIKTSMIPKDHRDKFTDYLVEITHKFVLKNEIDSWEEFVRHPKTRRIAKILFDFGVRGEVFPLEEEDKLVPSVVDKRLTINELYELCQIKFNFDGSLGSFKKMISKRYGSFGEYCLERGYDINNTKWESDETALRVAKKIGSLEKIKIKSSSLYKYLLDNNLLDKIFDQRAG